jgi:hypothetical protein
VASIAAGSRSAFLLASCGGNLVRGVALDLAVVWGSGVEALTLKSAVLTPAKPPPLRLRPNKKNDRSGPRTR